MADEGAPRYGTGKRGRRLWTERDRDAEGIRRVLRRAGRREWTECHGGFVVEAGAGGSAFLVAFADSDAYGAQEQAAYKEVLFRAGYRVQVDAVDRVALEVWPPADVDRSRIGLLRRLTG